DWTDYCNAKCFFCSRNISGGDFIPLAKLTKLEKVLSSVKYFSMSSAIGEPLLHPELRQILEWLYRINPTVSVRVTTNGSRVAERERRRSPYARHVPAPGRARHRRRKEMGASSSSHRGIHRRAARPRSHARAAQHDRASVQHRGYHRLHSCRPASRQFARDNYEYHGASEHRELVLVRGARPL